jgi:uncharacterized oxidoreductase
MPNLSAQQLESFAREILVAGGVQADEADVIAESLVGANLRGHDSHGVMRIPYYLEFLKDDDARTGEELSVIKESPAHLVVDANWGFGQVQARRLTERLIAKAREIGVGVGTMIHCSHIGRLGEYCEMAAERGLVAMMMVNTHGHARRIAPPGGKRRRLGTNPLAIASPHEGSPLVLDIGTSATAEGKVRVKKIAGEPCPEGWIIDEEGRPTTDPNAIYDEEGTILPMGGAQAYKGFGLGLMVEILTGALSGGDVVREKPTGHSGNCVFMLVLDPEHFGGAAHFATEVKDLAAFVRSCPTIDAGDEILLPGDPEQRTMAARRKTGIVIDEGNWRPLVELAESLGVTPPVE